MAVPAILLSILASPAAAASGRDDDCLRQLHDVPAVLDPAFRHDKRLQVEASPYGGTYLGATVGKSFIAGLRAALHLDDTWALQADYGYSRFPEAASDPSLHLLTASVLISNDVAMRFGRAVVFADLYLTAGTGAMLIDGRWSFLARLGGGMRVYTGVPWLAVRVDVDTYMHPPSGGGLDADASFSLGLSFLFPATAAATEGGVCPARAP